MNKLLIAITGLLAFTYVSCRKTEIATATTTDVNIYSYLKQNPDKFSTFADLVAKSGYAGFLNAYGSYTVFVPTNDALQAYLTEKGLAGKSLDSVQAREIVKMHIIQNGTFDTLTTIKFKDGKLPYLTMYGQYLVTGVSNLDGLSSYTVNRTARITLPNIRTGNGVIHGIDHVLQPATSTLAKLIEDNPDYSIFLQAIKETGYYDSLNITNNPDTTRRWLTVMAESDKALRDTGISSYSQLRARYCNTGNPKANNDSLHLYVAYHILTEAKYLSDIVSASSHMTLAPLEVVTSKLSDTSALINDLDFNGVHESGIALERVNSDITATNGVLHRASRHLAIKVRVETPVYWDVADFPEIRKLPAYFRKASYSFAQGSLKDYTWEKGNLAYNYTTASNFPMYYNDYLNIPLGLTNSARNKWIEMKTPLLVKGKYKVWVCYRRQQASTRNPPFPTMMKFDGEPMSRLFDFAEFAPSGTQAEQEALGWKRYTETNNSSYCARLLGTIEIKITDRHNIRLECVSGAGQDINSLDMIHFIPVKMDQVKLKFRRDGTTFESTTY